MPRNTVEGLGVGAGRKGGQTSVCMLLGFSYPNREIGNQNN